MTLTSHLKEYFGAGVDENRVDSVHGQDQLSCFDDSGKRTR